MLLRLFRANRMRKGPIINTSSKRTNCDFSKIITIKKKEKKMIVLPRDIKCKRMSDEDEITHDDLGGLEDILGGLKLDEKVLKNEIQEPPSPQGGLKAPLKGNEKRKASCKAVGSSKKRGGHNNETIFNEFFGKPSSQITYKAEADCCISSESPSGASLIQTLTEKFGTFDSYGVSIKSGENLQFVLGKIPEIADKTDDEKLVAVRQYTFWEKYLAKSHSSVPAFWIAYRFASKKEWLFFKMADVITYIVENCKWRFKSSGRMKGDFDDNSKKGFRQYLTYEYRPSHKSHMLGANGGKGIQLIKLLQEKIPCILYKDPEPTEPTAPETASIEPPTPPPSPVQTPPSSPTYAEPNIKEINYII